MIPALRVRLIFVALWCLILGPTLHGQTLKPRVDADRLRVTGPQVRLLAGRPLERLHNGGTVVYALQLTIRNERSGRVLSRVTQRFSFSYDLWEEKFAVTRLDSPTRSVSNLSITRAEAWCLENLSVAVADVPADRPFWIALEYESEEVKDLNKEVTGLTDRLIDIFSRRPRDEEQVRGTEQVEVLSLKDLIKKR